MHIILPWIWPILILSPDKRPFIKKISGPGTNGKIHFITAWLVEGKNCCSVHGDRVGWDFLSSYLSKEIAFLIFRAKSRKKHGMNCELWAN